MGYHGDQQTVLQFPTNTFSLTRGGMHTNGVLGQTNAGGRRRGNGHVRERRAGVILWSGKTDSRHPHRVTVGETTGNPNRNGVTLVFLPHAAYRPSFATAPFCYLMV